MSLKLKAVIAILVIAFTIVLFKEPIEGYFEETMGTVAEQIFEEPAL